MEITTAALKQVQLMNFIKRFWIYIDTNIMFVVTILKWNSNDVFITPWEGLGPGCMMYKMN